MSKIAVDAGHGKYTAGKRCATCVDKNQTREWVLNNRVANQAVKTLKEYGHLTMRVDDTSGKSDVPLPNRCNKANIAKADFYISIHFDSGIGCGLGGGTTTFRALVTQAKSKVVQQAIYKRAIEYGKLKGNRSNGLRTANFYVLNATKMPAVLIECGFMDSKTDAQSILDPEWSKKIGIGIAMGIIDIYGGKKKKSTTSKKKAYTGAMPTDTVNTRTGTKKNVKRWQKFLNWMLNAKLDVDGDFGPKTKTATMKAQKLMGFTGKAIDGSAGPNTRAKAVKVKK